MNENTPNIHVKGFHFLPPLPPSPFNISVGECFGLLWHFVTMATKKWICNVSWLEALDTLERHDAGFDLPAQERQDTILHTYKVE